MRENALYAAMGATAVLFLAIGIGVGFGIWGQKQPAPGAPLPEARQGDTSLILERTPASPPAAPHSLPRRGIEERRVSATVQPADAACAPVRVDLSLIRMPDGSGRVVASSQDGTVTGGLDVPIAGPLPVFAPRLWAAGVSYAGDQALGVFVHRDVWRARIGLEVNAVRDGGAEARIMAGWLW